MRTTLDLDEDVLQAAKEIADRRGATAGRVVSDLLRVALRPSRPVRVRNGVPLMPPLRADAPPVTARQVNQLRDD